MLSLKKLSTSRLKQTQKRFISEVIGTFIVVVFATGALVIDAKFNGTLGLPFIAFLSFLGVAVSVRLFAKVSMAHFNPAVTLGFLIIKHITKTQLAYYFTAELTGALLGSLFVLLIIGNEANLGVNPPNYGFPLPIIFGIEVLASALLMAVIVTVVFAKGLMGYGGLLIGGIVGLDIFFLSFISGASMNPARSFAPSIVSGEFANLWLYWSATFVGTSIVTLFVRKKLFSRGLKPCRGPQCSNRE